ncbi:MAG: hypothetical protein PHO66_03925 [Eubacteriales bacterium]|nr:hypothetical protein [Eubacteriales bacterium]
MLRYLWPIALVVAANTLYNIAAKSTPQNVDAFASLFVTYLVAAASSLILFFAMSPSKNLVAALGKVNWTAAALGVAVVALEFGYIQIYRAGWKVSVGSLVANIALACILLLVGVLVYKEAVSPRQLIGMLVCGAGLFLISQ